MTGRLTTKTTSAGREYYYIVLSYKDPRTKKWKNKYVKTGLVTRNNKKQASKLIGKAIEQYSHLETDGLEASADTPISDFIDHWFEDRKTVVKASTWEGYSYRVEKLKRYCREHGNPMVSDVTPKYLKQMFVYFLNYGKTNQKTGDPESLSVRSVRSYKSLMKSVFDLAIIEGVVSTNPTLSVKVGNKSNKSYRDGYLFLTEDEITEFLQFLSEKHEDLLGMAFFGIYYGLRRSEILGLKWSAINYKRKVVEIRHTVVRVGSVHDEDSTKTTASRRELDLFDTAITCLDKIKEKQNADKKFFKSSYLNKDGYVFCWNDGHAYSPDYVSRRFKKAAAEFGRPDITLHKLRHTCASLLISNGWDIKKVQHWMGHEDIQTTLDIYAHYVKQSNNQEGDDVNRLAKQNSHLFAC